MPELELTHDQAHYAALAASSMRDLDGADCELCPAAEVCPDRHEERPGDCDTQADELLRGWLTAAATQERERINVRAKALLEWLVDDAQELFDAKASRTQIRIAFADAIREALAPPEEETP